jgi:GT2 family glycosyltransferase
VSGPNITVIVVSRGLDALLKHCLETLHRALKATDSQGGHAVVVVDNGSEAPYSRDGMSALGAHLIRFDKPRSFATANNAAAKSRPNDCFLLLNNDVFLAEAAITSMLEVMERMPNAGICGSRLLFPDGSIQHCGVVFGEAEAGPYHIYRKKAGHLVPRGDREWQAVTGACMLVKQEVWEALSGLDESYPFGLEDIDFCLRARQRGWRIFCCNDTDSLHFESMTPGRVELDVDSRRLFMQRWQGRYGVDG